MERVGRKLVGGGRVSEETAIGNGAVAKSHTDANGELRFDYRVTDTSTATYARARLRCTASDDFLYVLIRPTAVYLGKKILFRAFSAASWWVGFPRALPWAFMFWPYRPEIDRP